MSDQDVRMSPAVARFRSLTEYLGAEIEKQPGFRQREPDWQRHRLGEDEYAEMLARHDGKCHLCKARPVAVVDHNHETGRVRGLLCGSCNTGLGLFGDSLPVLLAAVDYILATDA